MTRDEEAILNFAMRYAMGRASMSTITVACEIKLKWKDIKTKNIFIRDVKRELSDERFLGHQCDDDLWRDLLKWMEENNE